MGVIEKVKMLFQDVDGSFFDVISSQKGQEMHIKKLAIAHAIDLIARMISTTELDVYQCDKNGRVIQSKNKLYYRLNVKANDNETATIFKYKLVCKLLGEQKALIILNTNKNSEIPNLYLADTWLTNKNILYPKKFENIVLSDEEGNILKLDRVFDKEEVIYLTLGNSKIKSAIDNFYNEYSKLLKVASKKYKRNNTLKYRLKPPGGQPALKDPITNEPISYNEYKTKLTEGIFSDEESIIMLSEAFDLIQLNMKENATSNNSSDYLNLVKDVCDKIAMAFDIPLDVFYGNKTEKSNGTNDFITHACNPTMKNIENELNAVLVGEKDFVKGEGIYFKRFCMQHKDITDMANSLDKLTAIGYSHNDINRFLGLPIVNEKWADEHFVTKNYANTKGGE